MTSPSFSQSRVLLVLPAPDTFWGQSVQAGLATVTLDVATKNTIDEHLVGSSYEVILIDGLVDEEVPELIGHIHRQQPAARLIVASSSPTWRRARDAFDAGAYDYVRKPHNVQEITRTSAPSPVIWKPLR